jgi:hypothetical protein
MSVILAAGFIGSYLLFYFLRSCGMLRQFAIARVALLMSVFLLQYFVLSEFDDFQLLLQTFVIAIN